MEKVKQPLKSRWLVALGAVLMQAALGAIYSFSVYTPTLKDKGFTNLDAQLIFSTGLATFAGVMVYAGFKLKVWGPRPLGFLSACLLAAGYFFASIVNYDFWGILVGLGLIGGAGIGLGYVVPIAVGVKWFPDKKGTITGLAVAGFGFGSLFWVKLAGSWGGLLDNADIGFNGVLRIYGAIFFCLVAGGTMFMIEPLPGYKPPAPKREKSDIVTTKEMPAVIRDVKGEESADLVKDKEVEKEVAAPVMFTPGEMLKTREFWQIFLTFVFSAGAGLMTIGLMKSYPKEALVEYADKSQDDADEIAGNAIAIFFSLANGSGRILWGMLSEKIGRKNAVSIMALSQGIFALVFILAARQEIFLYIMSTLIGFNFGGNFALFPALTADVFGNAVVGQNYPFVFLAYGVGGIFGPVLGGSLGDSGNFPLAFMICGVLVIVGGILAVFLKPPKKSEKGDLLGVSVEIEEARFVPNKGRSAVFHALGYIGIAVGLVSFGAYALDGDKHIGLLVVSVLLWAAFAATAAAGAFYAVTKHVYGATYFFFYAILFLGGALLFANITDKFDETAGALLLVLSLFIALVPVISSAFNVQLDNLVSWSVLLAVVVALLNIIYDAPLEASAVILFVGAILSFYGALAAVVNGIANFTILKLGAPVFKLPEALQKKME